MKKIFALVLAMVMCVCAAAETAATSGDVYIDGMPNPVIEHVSLAELSEKVGFEVVVPEVLGAFERKGFFSIDTLAQVIYMRGEQELCWRMSPAADGDNSGDYNDYATVTTETIGEVSVTFKGNDNEVSLALWTLNGYDYSVGVREPEDSLTAHGVSMDEMLTILNQLGIA